MTRAEIELDYARKVYPIAARRLERERGLYANGRASSQEAVELAELAFLVAEKDLRLAELAAQGDCAASGQSGESIQSAAQGQTSTPPPGAPDSGAGGDCPPEATGK